MQTIFCIWMARSQILTSTCLNCLKYMIILASSDRKQYQYFHKFFHCASDQLVPVYFTLSCIMLLLVSWRITFSRGTSMRSRLQWSARPCTFTRIQSSTHAYAYTHTHTKDACRSMYVTLRRGWRFSRSRAIAGDSKTTDVGLFFEALSSSFLAEILTSVSNGNGHRASQAAVPGTSISAFW